MTGSRKGTAPSVEDQVRASLAWFERHGTKRGREGMARYAIHADKAFGVSMTDIQKLGKQLGRNHALAAGLWATGWYEARMLTAYVDEPARVTPAQMDRWARDFDNWAVCDTLCFALWDRTPHAWAKVTQWSGKRAEFIKRAAFALLWSLTTHDKQAGDKRFTDGLILIERAADDERNFVKKAVNMALRAIGKRNPALNAAAIDVARRLAELPEPTPRWIGKDALRELTGPKVRAALARRASA